MNHSDQSEKTQALFEHIVRLGRNLPTPEQTAHFNARFVEQTLSHEEMSESQRDMEKDILRSLRGARRVDA